MHFKTSVFTKCHRKRTPKCHKRHT